MLLVYLFVLLSFVVCLSHADHGVSRRDFVLLFVCLFVCLLVCCLLLVSGILMLRYVLVVCCFVTVVICELYVSES